MSVTLQNLYRLAYFAEDRHEKYGEKAKGILRASGTLLEHAPHALGGMVGALLAGQKGFRQVRIHPLVSSASTRHATHATPVVHRLRRTRRLRHRRLPRAHPRRERPEPRACAL